MMNFIITLFAILFIVSVAVQSVLVSVLAFNEVGRQWIGIYTWSLARFCAAMEDHHKGWWFVPIVRRHALKWARFFLGFHVQLDPWEHDLGLLLGWREPELHLGKGWTYWVCPNCGVRVDDNLGSCAGCLFEHPYADPFTNAFGRGEVTSLT